MLCLRYCGTLMIQIKASIFELVLWDMRSYIRNGLRYRCWKKCFFVFKVWKAEAKRAKITALDTFWVSAYSSQVLVVLITKEFILNFEPVSWFRLEDCYISFPVSLNAKKEEKKGVKECVAPYMVKKTNIATRKAVEVLNQYSILNKNSGHN